MVAVIKFSSSLSNVLNYNENKLKQEVPRKSVNEPKKMKAELIHSSGFGKDTEKLGFTDKFKRLEKQMKLNEGRKKSVVHISLNFDPSEQLTKEKLQQIADVYMQKIGFEKQPYLVYQHHDAGHPHVHIVTTIIQNNGASIDTHNIGRNVSDSARKEIEKLFGLVKADAHKLKEAFHLQPISAQKIQYGKSDTRRAITNVLDVVLFNYKYTSLGELNAVLQQYNVTADPGGENSRISKNRGLVYRVLDEAGHKVGTPIKASSIYCKPGLAFLEKKFGNNELLRKPHKQRVKSLVDLALSKRSLVTMEELQNTLRRDKIQAVVRINAEGRIYGITFIDHHTKCVFNGSDLGKQYSASGIQERIMNQSLQAKDVQKQNHQHQPSTVSQTKDQRLPTTQQKTGTSLPAKSPKQHVPAQTALPFNQPNSQHNAGDNVLMELAKPDYTPDTIPGELKRKKKKKKRRIHL